VTAPALDERLHDSALRALLKGPLNEQVYGYGEVPGADGVEGELPDVYVVMAVERRTAPVGPGGFAQVSGWRVYIRGVGRSVAEARWAIARATAALDGARIEVAGVSSTPIAHESSAAVRPDDGRQSGLVEFIYAL
jgi:hypothetical protein